MEKGRLKVASAVMVIAMCFAGPAMAAGNGPCAADAKKFCGDAGRGQGRIAGCLKEHESDLTPACKKRISEVKQKVADFAEACRDDASRLCKGVRPGGGRILQCLKTHEQELSPACQERMKGS